MRTILVIAPHPDDETLGCGGTLLRHNQENDEIHWLIITAISQSDGWAKDMVDQRAVEIDKVAKAYGFEQIHQLFLPAIRLDLVPIAEIVEKIGRVIDKVQPEIMYTPFSHDVHTDHKMTATAASSCTKWFRYPSIRRVLAYETISETDSNMYNDHAFKPNVFIDISPYIDRKIEIMKIFISEFGEHPFPRSESSIRALALLRGSQCGYGAAEAFKLLIEKL